MSGRATGGPASDARKKLALTLAAIGVVFGDGGIPALVLLATAASIIASQAVISGAFSPARQSVQLGFWPRIQVRHSSDETAGWWSRWRSPFSSS
ncbi:MAG TPA: KUP/HAK/KT family potassium transporter [Rectinemataceae bacterium]|nr:KUP/HAK/KT family potassium transporter [Rectinemataceae bacterium]